MSGYMTKERLNICLVGERWDFAWDERDITAAEHMWREGLSVEDMAVAFDRPARDVFIMLMDRLELGTIRARRGWMFGNKRR